MIRNRMVFLLLPVVMAVGMSMSVAAAEVEENAAVCISEEGGDSRWGPASAENGASAEEDGAIGGTDEEKEGGAGAAQDAAKEEACLGGTGSLSETEEALPVTDTVEEDLPSETAAPSEGAPAKQEDAQGPAVAEKDEGDEGREDASAQKGQEGTTVETGEEEIHAEKEPEDIPAPAAEETAEGWTEENGKLFYRKENGTALKGRQQIDGRWFFFDKETGEMSASAWVEDSGSRYYAGTDGTLLTGWQTIGGQRYYLSDEKAEGFSEDRAGAALTGIRKIGTRKYCFSDGKDPAGGPAGAMQTGFRTVGNRTWYFMDEACSSYDKAKEGIMLSGFRTVGGKNYYFMDARCEGYSEEKQGFLLSGFRKIGTKTYYMYDRRAHVYTEQRKGTLAKGIRRIGARTYSFSGTGAMQKGTVERDGKIYYFSESGARQVGWIKAEAKKVYMPRNAERLRGWKKISGKKYYFGKGNVAKQDAQIMGGRIYYFGKSGVLQDRYTRPAKHFSRLSEKDRVLALDLLKEMLESPRDDGVHTYTASRSVKMTESSARRIRDAVSRTYLDPVNIWRVAGSSRDNIMINTVNGRVYIYYYRAHDDIDNAYRLRTAVRKSLRDAGVRNGDSENTKVQKIIKKICRDLEYDDSERIGDSDDRNSVDVLDCLRYGRAICAYYTEYFMDMCTEAGIRCQILRGFTSEGDHAWNRVMIDGKWKYADVTWYDIIPWEYGLTSRQWWDHYTAKVKYDNKDIYR